jgi:hypothetical protein
MRVQRKRAFYVYVGDSIKRFRTFKKMVAFYCDRTSKNIPVFPWAVLYSHDEQGREKETRIAL